MTTTLEATNEEAPDGGSVAPARSRDWGGWRKLLVWIGWTLIVSGLVILLFVAYLLWGTRMRTERAQAQMRSEFVDDNAAALAELATRQAAESRQALLDALYAERDRAAAQEQAGPVAHILIPKIGVDALVVAGTDTDDLRRGPGNMLSTVPPGAPGNSVISGHRVTYGAEFHRLDELTAGDEIVVETLAGRTTYQVNGDSTPLVVGVPTSSGPETAEILGSQVVEHDSLTSRESAARIFTTQDGPSRITLTTCHPKFSARERLVVVADMVDGPFMDHDQQGADRQ